MSTSTPQRQKPVDALSLLEREIRSADSDRRPISRQSLAELLRERTGIPNPDAVALVDEYCDEKAPGVPYYLQDEFAIPYLKVIAIINALIGGGVYWYGVTAFRAAEPGWPWFCLGTIIVGLGVLAWVKSLERFVARKRKGS